MHNQHRKHEPTPKQLLKMIALGQAGYETDLPLSLLLGGMVMRHPTTEDYYIFTIDGQIKHKPYPITVVEFGKTAEDVAHSHYREN
jgi:hypothetical protein